LPFAQSGEAGSFKGGYVDEYVLPAASRAMKPKPFATLNHFTVPVSSTAVSEDGPSDVPETGSPWCWGGSAAIDAQHFGDVWPLVTWADTHFESFVRLDSADPALSQQAPMKKASPDLSESSTKPKPFSGLNHLTIELIGEPEGASNRGWLNRGRVPNARGPWIFGIRVELATPRITEILMSHFGSGRGGPDDSGRAGFLLGHGSAEVLV